ncbi:MAG: YjzC family protein [Clostridia bacterium]|nr:YjzC family protein [Clostridia bacterium]
MQKFNPGEVAPRTGYYNVIDSNGSVLDTISVEKGNRFPPTQSSDYHYEFKTC